LDVSAGDGDGPAEVLVWADAEKLAQVLLNLLSNAVKFTAEGGRVSVTTAAGRDAPDGTPCAVVRVADTGFGIAPEHLERVFEPFVQVHRQQARESQQGTGLGLAISRDLARGMGGELAAESEVGRGSTFTVTLRRATTEDGRATERRGREERRDDDRRSDEDRRHVTPDQAAGAPPGGGAGAG
jgi:signal transduction histidine kinase